MANYLIQATFTAEAWKSLLKKPVDRGKVVRPIVEKLGGSMINSWYSFGEYDIVLLVEFPDNVSVASLALALAAGGALKSLKTTPLMEVTEGQEAMKRAAKSGYRPPGK